MAPFSNGILLDALVSYRSPATPLINQGFRLFRFRSPLLPKSLLLSLPPLTKMFQFGGLFPLAGCTGINQYGLPHSEIPGSKLFRQFPGAYRSQSRPSSTCSAKVFSMCRYNLINFPNIGRQEFIFYQGEIYSCNILFSRYKKTHIKCAFLKLDETYLFNYIKLLPIK